MWRRGGSFTGRGSLSDVGNSIKIAGINVLLQTTKRRGKWKPRTFLSVTEIVLERDYDVLGGELIKRMSALPRDLLRC